jgi:hypothetical protein
MYVLDMSSATTLDALWDAHVKLGLIHDEFLTKTAAARLDPDGVSQHVPLMITKRSDGLFDIHSLAAKAHGVKPSSFKMIRGVTGSTPPGDVFKYFLTPD